MVTIAEALKRAYEHHNAGQLPQADQWYRQILQADPKQAEAWNGVGVVAQQSGQHEQAVQYFQQAINIDPSKSMFYSNMGVALHDMGRYQDAVNCHQQALKLNDKDPAAFNNLGIVMRDLGRLPEAMACCKNAIRLRPDYAEAHNNMGNVHKDQNNFDEAQRCYEYAVKLNPKYGPAFNNLGVVYREQGKYLQARECFAKAYAIDANDGLRIKSALVMPIILESEEQMLSQRERLIREMGELLSGPLQLADPVVRIGMTVFYPAYHGFNDRQLHQDIAAVFLKATPSLGFVAPHCQPGAPPRAPGRLRIGFVSKFFHEHTISKLTTGFVRNLSRDKFEVTVFRYPGNEDRWADYMKRSADSAITLSPRIEHAREQVAARQLDVLFYPDIGMDPLTYCLALARLAPVQCVTWGHPVTTGIPTIDYFISSLRLEPPHSADHYSEKLVLLRDLPTCYYPPERGKPTRTRADFNLPEDKHVYLCPQSLFKFHPQFDEVLRKILADDPQGVLVLLSGQQAHWTKVLNDRFNRSMPEFMERILYVSRQTATAFIDMLAAADVILDPLHFSGGNTSYEAFGVGTPIVTLPGDFMRSRVTYAMYHMMGFEDCVARDRMHYAEIAVRLGTDPAWREEIKQKILASNRVLYENMDVVRELESVLQDLVAASSPAAADAAPAG